MSQLELREPTFLVLAALADGPKHGYALIKEAEAISGGRVRLRVGTLYAALDRLGEQGLVRSAGDEIVDGRLRRYSELTESGLAALDAEIARMEANARNARERIRRGQAGGTARTAGATASMRTAATA